MGLDTNSTIRDAWAHPAGHDLLERLLHQGGRREAWAASPLTARLNIKQLDRFAWPGFSAMLLELAATDDAPCEGCDESPAWWKEAVVYQVYLPSFMDSDHDGMGDLAGVLQRLPYLEKLGVDVLWLSPLLAASREGAVRDYRRVNPLFGDEDDLADLIDAAHNRGMRVVIGLDIAATDDEHPWFRSMLAGEEGYEGFYLLREGSADAPPNNWRRSTGGAAWKWYAELGAWVLRVRGRRRMELNWDNPAVRRELAEVLRFWKEAGVDGFCFGSANQISKAGFEDGSLQAGGLLGMVGYEKYGYGPGLHSYLRQLRRALGGGDTLVMGEVRSLGTETAKRMTAKGELDMVLDAGHLTARVPPPGRRGGPEATEGTLSLADLKQYYLHWMRHYGHQRWMSLFFETAETPRLVSRLGASALYRGILAKQLATWLLTLRGTPILYQGEELGLANTRFSSAEELRDAGSLRQYAECCQTQTSEDALRQVLGTAADHARTPIPWSSGPQAGFTGALPWMRLPDGAEYLNAAVQLGDPQSVLCFCQRLIALRRQNSCLVYGSFKPVFEGNRRVFCYFRILGGEKWYVEMNLTEKQVPRPGRITASQKLELSNYDAPSRALRPYEANLYRCE